MSIEVIDSEAAGGASDAGSNMEEAEEEYAESEEEVRWFCVLRKDTQATIVRRCRGANRAAGR